MQQALALLFNVITSRCITIMASHLFVLNFTLSSEIIDKKYNDCKE